MARCGHAARVLTAAVATFRRNHVVCSILQNLSKHGGRCDISVQYYDKNGLNDTTDLRKCDYARLNPVTWSNNNKIFVSLQHVNNKTKLGSAFPRLPNIARPITANS